MTRLPVLVLPALVLLSAALAAPAVAQSRSVQSTAVPDGPVLDGVLEPLWLTAPPITEFVQIDPVLGAQPSQRTEVRVLHDARHLYIAATLHESEPTAITRKLMVRQPRLGGDDRLQLVLDTFGDRRNGYLFEVNPNGLRADALIENNDTLLEDWDGIWSAATQVHADGWTVELRIPFTTLAFDPSSTEWGLNVLRVLASRNETLSWNGTRRVDNPLAPAYAGQLTGLVGLEQGLGLDVIPSLTLRAHEDPAGRHRHAIEPSLDVLYRPSNALTAALTLNTDFSATEVDARTVNLSRFSLFLPEKRTFFLQDAGIFEFGGIAANGRPFFSRTIGLAPDGTPVEIDGGIKLTGRHGPASFGALAVRQDASATRDAASLFVGRAMFNVLEESYVGAIVTDGDPHVDRENTVGGIDFRLRDSTWLDGDIVEASGWIQQSHTPGGGADDRAWRAQVRLPNDRLFLLLARTAIGRDFDPAMGFVNRRDIRADELFLRLRHRPQDGFWLAHNASVYANRITDMEGNFQSSVLEIQPWGPFSSRFDYFGPVWQRNHEVLAEPFLLFGRIPVPAGEYRYDFSQFTVETAETRALRVTASIGSGGFFHGRRDAVSVDASWRPHPRFALDLFWSWNDVTLPGESFTARVQRLKTSVALSPRMAWVTLAQYDTVSRELGIDTRLQWLPEAGREWYLVLQHGAQRDAGSGLLTRSNEAIVKLVHTLRF